MDRRTIVPRVDRTVVLVEGASDQVAVLTLAARLGRDLTQEGVLVAATGGVTNIGRHLERLGPRGLGIRVAGLYDAGEERFVRKGLERAGLGAPESQADLEDQTPEHDSPPDRADVRRKGHADGDETDDAHQGPEVGVQEISEDEDGGRQENRKHGRAEPQPPVIQRLPRHRRGQV